MLIVLSDLHFSEAQSTQIGPYDFNRNLPPEAFMAYFSEINQFAVANGVKKVDLVLAGDILEISRSSIWLEGEERPYVNNEAVQPGSRNEAIILRIIQAISEEEKVKETLALFRDIGNHFDMEIELHLLLGNHDRLVNATPNTRNALRSIFGVEGGDRLIDHYMIVKDHLGKPFCLVRHGHEYDPTNFSVNVRKMKTIPTHFPSSVYGKSCLGDITSIEFGAALSWLFLEEYGEAEILADQTLMALYRRLMEFDDVRPTTAWLSYLFSTPGVEKRRTWQLVRPSFTKIINTLSEHEQFNRTLKQSDIISKFGRLLLMGLLKSGLFRDGIPFWLTKRIMKIVSRSIKLPSQAKWAKREALIKDKESGCQCVISGHTHFAEVSLISASNENERYYINTGTWRNVIPATKNFENFGRLKALTKVMVVYPMEKNDPENKNDWAFHYLSGVSFGDHRLV